MSMTDKAARLISLLEEYKKLGIAEQIDYHKFYLYSIITHSTAIEGSTVTEIENQLLFDEGISAKGRSVQELMMNLDLKAAYEHSMELAGRHTDFSIPMLTELSAKVMKNTGSVYHTILGDFDASKGELRLLGVTAGIGGSSYMDFRKVPAKLEEFCRQTNFRRRQLLASDDVVEKYMLSFDAHYQLATIHPWADGNGRMARLVMNHLQYELGLVPSKIVKENKAEYIQALVDSRTQETLAPFRQFMLDEHIRNLAGEIAAYKKSLEFDPINGIDDLISSSLDPISQQLYQAILHDNGKNYAGYALELGVSEATVKRHLGKLRKAGLIARGGSNKTGHWKIANNKEEDEV